jgi:hypothetical protein
MQDKTDLPREEEKLPSLSTVRKHEKTSRYHKLCNVRRWKNCITDTKTNTDFL